MRAAAALLALAMGALSVGTNARVIQRSGHGANTRTNLPESRHRYQRAGNPAGSKLAKKAAKGTLTIRQG